jgi:hypothetical protein
MHDSSSHTTGVVRPDRRQRPMSEHWRRERDSDGKRGNHYAGDQRLTRSRYRCSQLKWPSARAIEACRQRGVATVNRREVMLGWEGPGDDGGGRSESTSTTG